MPTINGVEVTTDLEVKLITALSELYKITYYYFKRSSTASVETQAKRTLAICKLLDNIRTEFNPPVEESSQPAIPTSLPDEENSKANETRAGENQEGDSEASA